MSILDQILAHLDAHERKDFLAYSQRQPDNPREVKLIRLMLQSNPPESAELQRLLYEGENMEPKKEREAFNSMRKQVLNRFYQWIMLKRMDSKSNHEGRIYALITAGRFMLERNAVETSSQLLLQAEKKAISLRKYEILESIYSYLISHASYMGMKVEDLSARWEANRKRYDRICHLQRLYAFQLQRVRNAKKEGLPLDPDLNIARIYKGVTVSKDDANDPAFMQLLCRLVRACLVSGKDYTGFERFVSKIYRRLKKHDLLLPNDKEYELDFLYMYAHAAYRNRKFALAEELCLAMGQLLGKEDAQNHAVFPRYMALRAGIAALSGKNAEAIELMNAALKRRVDTTEISEWLNNQLNLSVYYFQADDFKKANRVLLAIEGNQEFWENEMGMEWCFKKNMIELIVQYELGNDTIALKSCDRILNLYSNMLKQQIYQRVLIFLKFIRRMIKDPQSVATPEFVEEVKNAQLAWPGYKEDVQAITFFCWLSSKMQKRPYYEVLLERLNKN